MTVYLVVVRRVGEAGDSRGEAVYTNLDDAQKHQSRIREDPTLFAYIKPFIVRSTTSFSLSHVYVVFIRDRANNVEYFPHSIYTTQEDAQSFATYIKNTTTCNF